MNRVQFLIIVIVTCSVVYVPQHEESSINFAEIVETTKIAADSVKFYCRLLVKLSICDSKVFSISFHEFCN